MEQHGRGGGRGREGRGTSGEGVCLMVGGV